MKTVVISLGGSAVVPDRINIRFLQDFRNVICELVRQAVRVVIVVGGGRTCRKYQDAARIVSSMKDRDLDWIGILATRLNAELVRSIFGDAAYEKVVYEPSQEVATNKKILIGAGWKPGFSSDMSAVALAKRFGAGEIINISNIDYVYDRDPKEHKRAKRLATVSWKDFSGMVGQEWTPGLSMPFDPVATKEAMQHKLKVKVLGTDIENIRKCLAGQEFNGTVID